MASRGVVANAVRVMQQATDQANAVKAMQQVAKVAAIELGRKGGEARAKSLSPERRIEIARKAAQARWQKAK